MTVIKNINEAQQHALGIIGGVAFGLERRTLVKLAKELASLGLVTTDGAHSGHNRSAFHWCLTDRGSVAIADLIRSGSYPLAKHTAAGRAVLEG